MKSIELTFKLLEEKTDKFQIKQTFKLDEKIDKPMHLKIKRTFKLD